jgi:hypothetical protein
MVAFGAPPPLQVTGGGLGAMNETATPVPAFGSVQPVVDTLARAEQPAVVPNSTGRSGPVQDGGAGAQPAHIEHVAGPPGATTGTGEP